MRCSYTNDCVPKAFANNGFAFYDVRRFSQQIGAKNDGVKGYNGDFGEFPQTGLARLRAIAAEGLVRIIR